MFFFDLESKPDQEIIFSMDLGYSALLTKAD